MFVQMFMRFCETETVRVLHAQRGSVPEDPSLRDFLAAVSLIPASL
jgi:hypothetical protein